MSTETALQIDNPLLAMFMEDKKRTDELEALTRDVPYSMWTEEQKDMRVGFSMSGMQNRERYCKHFSWAVPDQGALDLLAIHAPIVEIGAGRGYWASLLRKMGVPVVAYDEKPYDNHWCVPSQEGPTGFTEVQKGYSKHAGLHAGTHTLFLCWPPYDTNMAYSCVYDYYKHGGKKVIFLGEGHGGCTGNDRFFEFLTAKYNKGVEYQHPTWDWLHDYMGVWERR